MARDFSFTFSHIGVFVTDLAKMVGFLSGLASRPKGAHRP